jgi:hypothetical protein
MTRNALFCIAFCAGFLVGCSPASDLTGDLRPPVTGTETLWALAPGVSSVAVLEVPVRWNAARYPMVMVKDARTGQVLWFARGGSARLRAGTGDFQLIFTDGVKPITRPGRIFQ